MQPTENSLVPHVAKPNAAASPTDARDRTRDHASCQRSTASPMVTRAGACGLGALCDCRCAPTRWDFPRSPRGHARPNQLPSRAPDSLRRPQLRGGSRRCRRERPGAGAGQHGPPKPCRSPGSNQTSTRPCERDGLTEWIHHPVGSWQPVAHRPNPTEAPTARLHVDRSENSVESAAGV
jgi:hypothetical protein